MKLQKTIGIIIAIFMIILATAGSRAAFEPSNLSILLNGNKESIQADEPPPDWAETILSAFNILGYSSEVEWYQSDESTWYGNVGDFMVDNHSLYLGISTQPNNKTAGKYNEVKTQEIQIGSQSALLVIYYKEDGDLDFSLIEWKIGNLYYRAEFASIWGSQTIDPVYIGAEAFVKAISGTSSSSAPVPQDIPSEPENFPGDLCTTVNCKNNYCNDDGTKFLYDCACNANDGKCYCSSISCDNGCDDVLGGCIMQESGDPNNVCAGVDCGPDYCLDDGKTRVHDCKCDPADGGCYCYSEVCEAGCNMATGKCEITMVIYDDSSDIGETLGIIGGIAVGGGIAIGGGYFGVKAIQSMLARRAVNQGAKMAGKAAAEAAEPSLSELLQKAEHTADNTLNRINKVERALQADEVHYRDIVGRNVKYDAQWAETMSKRAALIEKAEFGVKAIKKGADMGAELVGNVPGVGNVYKYGYNLTTTAVESAAGGDSLGEVVLKTSNKGIETFVGDKLFGSVTHLDKMATDTISKTVKQVIRDTGADKIVIEGVKNEGMNNFMNIIKEVKSRSPFGRIEKKVEAAAKNFDRKAAGKVIKRILHR